MFKNKKEYTDQRKALLEKAEAFLNSGNVEEYEKVETEIKNLDEKFEKYAQAQANINALKDGESKSNIALMTGDNKLDMQTKDSISEPEDKFSTLEYRKAFMNFCKTGVMDKTFRNDDTYTGADDAGSVIPTTILQEIISKMEAYGNIYSRVRKISVKGGVDVPILSLKPTATWIGEDAVSNRKKIQINTKVSFSYYGLECRIAVSLLADTTTLDIFERTVKQLLTEAMVKALDTAIIKGTGDGQPTGITVDSRIPADNVITLTSKEFITWDGWKKKVFAKIPLAYRAGGNFIMAAGTFEGYIDGMTDANGQPIGRVNYGITSGQQERFAGKEVILVEDDIIAPYESAGTGDIVAIFCKLSDYCINSNMQLKMFRWLDHETNQWVDKAILIADGKILDPNGVLIIKKGA